MARSDEARWRADWRRSIVGVALCVPVGLATLWLTQGQSLDTLVYEADVFLLGLALLGVLPVLWILVAESQRAGRRNDTDADDDGYEFAAVCLFFMGVIALASKSPTWIQALVALAAWAIAALCLRARLRRR